MVVPMAHTQFYWCMSLDDEGVMRTAGPYRQYTLADTGPAFSETVQCSVTEGTLNCANTDKP